MINLAPNGTLFGRGFQTIEKGFQKGVLKGGFKRFQNFKRSKFCLNSQDSTLSPLCVYENKILQEYWFLFSLN